MDLEVVMRRPFLLTVTALGLVVCLVGSTGLFAALTDTAATGTNQVTTPGLASSADIQLAFDEGTPGSPTCGAFSDDLATGLFDFTAESSLYQSRCDRLREERGQPGADLALDASRRTHGPRHRVHGR